MSFETTPRSRRRKPLLAAAITVVLLSCVAPAAAFAADGATESADAAVPAPAEPAVVPASVPASEPAAEAEAGIPAAAPTAPPSEPAVGIGPQPVTQDGIDAVDDFYEVDPQPESSGGPVLHIGPPGVLGNDLFPAESAVTVTSVGPAAHGTVTWGPTGWFIYEADAGYSGPDSFSYEMSTGIIFDSAIVTIQVNGAATEPGNPTDGEQPADGGDADAPATITEVADSTATPEGELAETGIDATGTLFAALTALTLGAVHLVFRRRATGAAR